MEKRRPDYQKALQLRSKGMTYGEINKVLGISKSTLSGWLKSFYVTGRAHYILKEKQGENMILLTKFNKHRSIVIKKENETIRKEFKSWVGSISIRELKLIGAALYWGEGRKVFNTKSKYGPYPTPSFSNSDPHLIRVFMRFLTEALGVKKSKIRPYVAIYPNLVPEESIRYWSNIINIPTERFHYYVALSKASRSKRPKNLLPYGTLHLKVSQRQEFFKIRGLIDGIIKSII